MDNLVVVISGPSGSGKSTVIQEILSKKKNTAQISTYTTREPRVGETDGRQYNFISPKEYLKLLNEKKLMACSRIEHNYYGMPLLEEKLQENNGMDLLIDMGVSGGLEIKERYPETIMIYLIPKTEEQLLKQRGNRGKIRQARGIKQIEEVLKSRKYDWLVVNEKLQETVENVEIIMDFMRKKKFGKISKDEMKWYKSKLKGLIFFEKENIEFLTKFYNRDRGGIEINE